MNQPSQQPFMKRCNKCREAKPLTAFSKHKGCKDGHSRRCKDCDRIYKQGYHAAHSDRYKATNARWRQSHAEEIHARVKKWKRANPDRVLASEHNRRAELLGAEGRFTAEELTALRVAQDGQCAYCQRKGFVLHIDHIVPMTLGGTNDISNIALACSRCNSSKNNRTPEQWTNRWYERKGGSK